MLLKKIRWCIIWVMDYLMSVFQKQMAHGSRSTSLNPLLWIFGVLLFSLFVINCKTEFSGICYLISGFLVLNILAIFAAYAYFAHKDPDALRSERFSIQKLAIEKGYYGDTLTGPIEKEEVSQSSSKGQGVIGE